MTNVVAGIIQRGSEVLICRRREDQPHALKWEFPGGKLEAGESPEQALQRELREELGIEATPGRELMRYEFAYPGKNPILLIFIEVVNWTGEIENLIFEKVLWEHRENLRNYDFLEGDEKFISGLR